MDKFLDSIKDYSHMSLSHSQEKSGKESGSHVHIKKISRNRKPRDGSVRYTAETNTIRWIETLLQIPISDRRKYALWRIVAPYLINIKKHDNRKSVDSLMT
jgi:hypothetical protein